MFRHLIPKLLIAVAILLASTACKNKTPEKEQKAAEKKIAVAVLADPTTFDPRLERTLDASTYLRMLYEGLMRADVQGNVQPALAKSIALSKDLKTYTFTLTPSFWSNGDPLTAHDFVSSWKSLLSPAIPSPNAYQFYMIKGAKEVKEGKLPLDSSEIGIKALDDHTLVVELEQPTPYFLQLLSCHFYFPIHKSLREQEKGENSLKGLISNGPFTLDTFKPRNEFSLIKNPNYWDKSAVALDRITFEVLDENTALQLYHTGKLDWIGSPLSTLSQEVMGAMKVPKSRQITPQIAPAAGTHWLRLNTLKAPFSSEKMRRAFALAINRKEIVELVTQGNQQPALAIVPASFGLKQNYFADGDLSHAKQAFEEGLKELGMDVSNLPPISISYATNERNRKVSQVIQQQWNKAFGIQVELIGSENKTVLEKMRQGNYQTALGAWYADFQDPINYLEIFALKTNSTNQTGWENKRYTDLIAQSNIEPDSQKRLQLLSQAEGIAMEAMPVIPIFFNAYNFLLNPKLKNVYFSPLGFIDFKHATLE